SPPKLRLPSYYLIQIESRSDYKTWCSVPQVTSRYWVADCLLPCRRILSFPRAWQPRARMTSAAGSHACKRYLRDAILAISKCCKDCIMLLYKCEIRQSAACSARICATAGHFYAKGLRGRGVEGLFVCDAAALLGRRTGS